MKKFFQNNKSDISLISGLILFVIFMCLILIWRHNYWERIKNPRYVEVVLPFENGDMLTLWVKTTVSPFDSLEKCFVRRFFWSQNEESLGVNIFRNPSVEHSFDLECVRRESEMFGVWEQNPYAKQYLAIKEGFILHDPLWEKPWYKKY